VFGHREQGMAWTGAATYLELILQHLAGRTQEQFRPSVRIDGKYKYVKYFLKEIIEKITKEVELTR
jgi:hypothetical protein